MRKSHLNELVDITQKFCDDYLFSKYRYLSKFTAGYTLACLICLLSNHIGFLVGAILSVIVLIVFRQFEMKKDTEVWNFYNNVVNQISKMEKRSDVIYDGFYVSLDFETLKKFNEARVQHGFDNPKDFIIDMINFSSFKKGRLKCLH